MFCFRIPLPADNLWLSAAFLWSDKMRDCFEIRGAFNDTNRKLTRYSNTVEKIKRMLLWWEGLTAVDQANISSIEKLVTQAEGIFQSERESLAVSYDIVSSPAKPP